MPRSTIIQPCNESGLLDAALMGRFGVVSLDWSNAKAVWANQRPMASDKLMVTQAQLIQKVNPLTRVWVYRNLVKALPWLSAVREKLEDPAYAGWFLRFDPSKDKEGYHSPPCDGDYEPPLCTALYHDQLETPQYSSPPPPSWPPASQCAAACDCGSVPCGEYLFDHRNASLRRWLVDVYIGGAEGIGNPAVSGIFLDDTWTPQGPTEEEEHAVADTGLSKADVAEMMVGYAGNLKAVQVRLICAHSRPLRSSMGSVCATRLELL
jgi:hypothetical protein